MTSHRVFGSAILTRAQPALPQPTSRTRLSAPANLIRSTAERLTTKVEPNVILVCVAYTLVCPQQAGRLTSEIRFAEWSQYGLGLDAGTSECFGPFYQIGQRLRSHFPHDMPTMDFHSYFGKSELGGNL